MGTTRHLLPGLAAGILLTCCAVVLVRGRWDGHEAAALSFREAMRVLGNKQAKDHERRAAAAILVAYCRMAVRALRGAEDIRDQVDLLLPQVESIIREPR